MEETIQRYHPLGTRTLFVFLLKRGLTLLPMWVILVLVQIFVDRVPFGLAKFAEYFIIGYSVLLFLFSATILLLGLLEYYRYWIFVDDKDLKIARGLISVEQIGIPYRRIKDLKIERSLLDQICGVSDVVIKILGSDENEFSEEKTSIVLPDLAKDIALQIQDIVLKKVQVEQVSVLGQRSL